MVNIIRRIIEKPGNLMEFDSGEESEFYGWCLEAKESGFIKHFVYHPEPFLLSERKTTMCTKVWHTKVKKERREKIEEVFLFHPHEYTADFKIVVDDKWKERFPGVLWLDGNEVAWIDVKGGFSQHNDQKSFSINQKWVFDKYGVIINKVVPQKFFPKTWVPESARYTEKTRSLKKAYSVCPTIEDVR